jgi:hypothetical protein
VPINEQPVISYLDVSYQERTGEWLTLNQQATKVEVTRGGKRQGVSNKIDVGAATISLAGELDVDASASLRPNTPIRVATRDGKPGSNLYTLPSPYVSDSGWIRSGTSGFALTAAVQSRPALGDVPAGNRLSYGFTSSATGSNPYSQTLAYRMVWGGNFVPGRRYRVSARANDLTAENNVPIRLVVSSNAVPSSPLLIEGQPRSVNANDYTEVPSVEFTMPSELTGSYINIGFGMSRMLPMPAGAAGTYMGVYLYDFKIEMLPQEPTSVITGRLSDLTQRNELDKDSGTVKVFSTIYATDAVAIHANTPRYGAVVENGGLFEPWENRINRLAASSQAPIEVPTPQTERAIFVNGNSTGWTGLTGTGVTPAPTSWTTMNGTPTSWPSQQSLELEYTRTGASIAAAAGTLGYSYTLSGLTPGATYRIEGMASMSTNTVTGTPSLRLGVAGLGDGTAVATPAFPNLTVLPSFVFTATGATHNIRITNGSSLTFPSGAKLQWLLPLLKVIQTAVASPYRLQDTVFESSLASHFDLACNSVGGYWWVDSQGVTRFRKYAEAQVLKGTWTDDPNAAWRTLPAFDTEVRRNLFPFPSFESAAIGTWKPSGGSASFSSAWSASGSRSLRLAPNSASTVSSIQFGDTQVLNFGMQAGKTYTLSGSVYTPEAQTGNLNAHARQIHVWSGNINTRESAEWYSPSGPSVGSGRVSVTFTLPAGTTQVYFTLFNGASNAAANNVYWDSILLEESSRAMDYFDGSTATGDSRYDTAWLGLANESTSVLIEHVPEKVEHVPGQFKYVDVDTAYDTRNLVTALEIEQKGRKVAEDGKDSADDTSSVYYDEPAVLRWGARSDKLTTSLYSGQGFESALKSRAEEIFTQYSNSQRTITGFRWNAQEDTAAALSLDIYDLVRVEYGKLPVTGRIVGLKHTITPTRHMVDISLTDVKAGVTWEELNLYARERTWAQLNALISGTVYTWTGTPGASASVLTFNGTETRRNRVPNPSFGPNTVGWTASSITLARSTDWSLSGPASMRATSTGGTSGDARLNGGGATSFPPGIEPGKTYTVSAYINKLAEDTGNLNRSRRMLVFISTPGNTNVETFGPQAPNEVGVHRISQTLTVPANATGCIIGVGLASTTSGHVTYVDNVLLEEGATLGEYFDGDTANPADGLTWAQLNADPLGPFS